MNHHAYRPYQPNYDGTFAPDAAPDDTLRITLTKFDGKWHVRAIEPGHAEHIHREAFQYYGDAKALRDQIRRGIEAGRDLDLQHWDTRRI